ncbi:MAG: TolC family protein [Campylobacterales bacterium]
MIRIVFALVLLISSSIANEKLEDELKSSTSSNVTLEQLVELVKRNNSSIKIAEFEKKIKEYERSVAVGYMFGSLDFSETYSRTNHAGYVFGMKMASRETTFDDFGFDQFLAAMPNLMNPATSAEASKQVLATQPKNLNHPDARDNYETKFSYQLPIYTGGKLQSYREIASKLQKLYGINKESVMVQKVAEAKKSYYDLLLLQGFIDDLEEIDANVKRLTLSVEEFIKEGYAKNVDLLEVKAKATEVEENLIKARANKELMLAFLSFLAGSDIVSVQGSFKEIDYQRKSADEIVQKNKNIKMAEVGSQIAKKNIDLEESSFYPTLGGFAEGGWNDNQFADFNDNDYYMFGVQAKLNIFNGGIDSANYQKAKIGYLKAKEQENQAKSGIKLQATQLLAEIKALEARVDALKAKVELNKQIYKNYEQRYIERLASMNDLLIKESELLEAVMKLHKVQNEKNAKIFEMEKLSGEEIVR